jgi:nucleoside-diphosphate kinase
MERTFIALKPDAVQRGLTGEIIGRFERKGFKLIGLKLMNVSRELAETHYGEHKGKPFFPGLVDFITSGPIVAMVWEGANVIATARAMMGATNPANATPGTIRGDFAVETGRNVIHGSDSPASAEREIGLFFQESELLSGWNRCVDGWIYEAKVPANV